MHTPARFCIDNGPEFAGFHDPAHRWNGWAVPSFTTEEGKKIAAWAGIVTYDETRDVFTDHAYPEEPTDCPYTDTPNGRLHGIGDGWVWDDVE